MQLNQRQIIYLAFGVGFLLAFIDYLGQWGNINWLTQVLKNDLEYFPSLFSAIAIGILFRKNIKAAALGIIVAVASALTLRLIAEQLITFFNPFSMLWARFGPQVSYLLLPTTISIILGYFAGLRFSKRYSKA